MTVNELKELLTQLKIVLATNKAIADTELLNKLEELLKVLEISLQVYKIQINSLQKIISIEKMILEMTPKVMDGIDALLKRPVALKLLARVLTEKE